MSMNLVTLLYLLASVCFIQALKGLSHPTTSIRGNIFGMSGMAIAVLTTGALIVETAGGSAQGMVYVMAALVVGGAAGTQQPGENVPPLVAPPRHLPCQEHAAIVHDGDRGTVPLVLDHDVHEFPRRHRV